MPVKSLIPEDLPSAAKILFGIAVENWMRYALVAGIAWLLAYVIFKKRWWRRKIIQKAPTGADVRRELKWSLLTAVIYGLVGMATILIGKTWGWQVYRKIDSHGWGWFVASIAITIRSQTSRSWAKVPLIRQRRSSRTASIASNALPVIAGSHTEAG